MTDQQQRILCITSYEKGQAFLRQAAALGLRVTLLTVDELRHADWPYDILDELITMPTGLSLQQVTNTVTYLARSRKFDLLVALDEFDMENAAALREHMRLPGMGRTVTSQYRDKLAMRDVASRAGALVPDFVGVLNYDDLREYMARVPAPWVLKPRADASAIGIRKIHDPEQLWRTLDELGDRGSTYLLERFVPGDIFHVDSVISERTVVFRSVSQYGKPPMQTMHEGGVFTTRILDRESAEAKALSEFNDWLMPAMGMVLGVTHAEYIRAHEDGRYYFLEAAARVGGAFIADVVEAATNVNPWKEWARIEVAALRGETYSLPELRQDYAGSVICLARTSDPDTTMFDAPEIVYRLKKHHHAGLIVRSADPERIRLLLEEYGQRFADEYLATAPVPDRATA
jgi:biotin carboxylase